VLTAAAWRRDRPVLGAGRRLFAMALAAGAADAAASLLHMLAVHSGRSPWR
jgi:hypothetical protein